MKKQADWIATIFNTFLELKLICFIEYKMLKELTRDNRNTLHLRFFFNFFTKNFILQFFKIIIGILSHYVLTVSNIEYWKILKDLSFFY